MRKKIHLASAMCLSRMHSGLKSCVRNKEYWCSEVVSQILLAYFSQDHKALLSLSAQQHFSGAYKVTNKGYINGCSKVNSNLPRKLPKELLGSEIIKWYHV